MSLKNIFGKASHFFVDLSISFKDLLDDKMSSRKKYDNTICNIKGCNNPISHNFMCKEHNDYYMIDSNIQDIDNAIYNYDGKYHWRKTRYKKAEAYPLEHVAIFHMKYGINDNPSFYDTLENEIIAPNSKTSKLRSFLKKYNFELLLNSFILIFTLFVSSYLLYILPESLAYYKYIVWTVIVFSFLSVVAYYHYYKTYNLQKLFLKKKIFKKENMDYLYKKYVDFFSSRSYKLSPLLGYTYDNLLIYPIVLLIFISIYHYNDGIEWISYCTILLISGTMIWFDSSKGLIHAYFYKKNTLNIDFIDRDRMGGLKRIVSYYNSGIFFSSFSLCFLLYFIYLYYAHESQIKLEMSDVKSIVIVGSICYSFYLVIILIIFFSQYIIGYYKLIIQFKKEKDNTILKFEKEGGEDAQNMLSKIESSSLLHLPNIGKNIASLILGPLCIDFIERMIFNESFRDTIISLFSNIT